MVEVLKKLEISPELVSSMQRAGNYEELKACWTQLVQELGLKTEGEEFNSLRYPLAWAERCFKDRGGCDSFIKNIFREAPLLEELDASGIPREFLFQTVRMGALKQQEGSISGPGKHEPVSLDVDLYGYTWANEQLKALKVEKVARAGKEKELAGTQAETRKGLVISQIALRMNDPEFILGEEEKALLRDDWGNKLRAWKAFCDKYGNHPGIAKFFHGEFANSQFSGALLGQFKEACRNVLNGEHAKYSTLAFDKFPFEIIDPESGWFYVLIKNKQNTIGRFLQSAVSNMCDWFKL